MKLTKVLLFLTEVSLPLYFLRCKSLNFCSDIFPIPFTLLEVLILATVVAWCIWKYTHFASGKDSLSRLIQRLKGPLLVPIGLFLVAALVNTLVASDFRGASGIFKAYFVEGFLLYAISLDYLLLTKDTRLVLSGLVFSGLWVSLLAILEWLVWVNPFAPQELLRHRVSAVYSTSNAVGLFVTPILILATGWLIHEYKSYREQIVWKLLLLSLPALSLGIFLSGSRGALVALGTTVLFLIPYFALKRLKPTLLPKAFLILVLVTLFAVAGYFANLNYFLPKNGIKSSIDSRLCFWDGTKNLITARPLIGSGLNDFHNQYPKYLTCGQEMNEYPHNIFLNFWTQVGLLGLVSFLWISFGLGYKLLKLKANEALRVSLVLIIVEIFIHGFVDVPFFKNDLAAQFWLLLALGCWLIKVGDRLLVE